MRGLRQGNGSGWPGWCIAAAVLAVRLAASDAAFAQTGDAGWATSTAAPAGNLAGSADGGGFETTVTAGGASPKGGKNRGHTKARKPQAAAPASTAAGREPLPDVLVAAVNVTGDLRKTRLTIAMSKGVRAEIFTLANPYRVVIDIPDTGFALPDGTGRTGAGLISAFRYGLFAERKARMVLDVTSPVRIDEARMTAARGGAVDLVVELVPTTAEEFGMGTGLAAGADAARQNHVALRDDDHKKGDQRKSAKAVILIDPGHGGIDPGTMGASNVLEKTIVLAVAKRLKQQLDAHGGFDVRMTRSTDVFVSLDDRVRMSRESGADLFVSLHADAIAQKSFAAAVRGATIYTLSETASDEQARQVAEKENASDLLAGIETGGAGDEGVVRDILLDLMKRETANYTADFASILTANMRKSVTLSRDPQRAAAFKVLRQPHAPSVLVELGFMSNAADEALLRQPEWQTKVARSIAAAVASFFDKRTARLP